MNASVATRKKDDLAVLVSPLRARLTRFLRHPHTLRDCSVPRARAEQLARFCITVHGSQADGRAFAPTDEQLA